MKRRCILILSVLLLISCEKEIDIDYRQVEPLYVVEASVSDEGMVARISRTQDVDDNATTSDVSQAEVIVTGSDGSEAVLKYTNKGFYRADNKGIAGVTYCIDIRLDGHHFSSTSTMQRAPRINKFHIVRDEIVGKRFLMAELLFQDISNEENWYFSHIYRNGLGYRWAVKRDDTNPNGELQQLFTIAAEDSNDADMLREGDKLRLELRAIDQRAYDYLYSMQMMDNTGTNPIQNFTGGCLGYFSAYSQVTIEMVYHVADVEPASP